MDLGLKGKRVLITGASKGIGLACALAYSLEGAQPILAARNEEALKVAVREIRGRSGVEVTYHVADLATPSGIEGLVNAVGDLDILVNNAGAIPGGSLDMLTDARWREAWELKLFGYINLTRAILPRMQESKRGVIVNVIGMAGASPKAEYICGGMANAALIALTRALGGESPLHGVRVFGINPSQTKTERTTTPARLRALATLGDEGRWEELMQGLPFGRLMDAEEVANLVVFGSSERAGYLSGTVIDLDGGQMYASAKK